MVYGQAQLKSYKRAIEHTEDFWKWMKKEVSKKGNISKELEVLAMGPNRSSKRYGGYVINGYRYHSKNREARCITQNSGVFFTALTTSLQARNVRTQRSTKSVTMEKLKRQQKLIIGGIFCSIVQVYLVPGRKGLIWADWSEF